MFDDNKERRIISMFKSGWAEDKSKDWTWECRSLPSDVAVGRVYIYALVKHHINFFRLVAFGATDFSKSFSDNFIEILNYYKNTHDDYYLFINPSLNGLSKYDMTDSMREQILRIVKR